jgi:hypothetical protein
VSSAILYLAIVAIWACVLIPRWLRRDTTRGASAPAEVPVPDADHLADEVTMADEDTTADDEEFSYPPERAVEPPSADKGRRRMLAARRRLLLMLIGLEAAAVVLAALRLAAVWVVVPPTIMLVGYVLLLREAAQADAERAQYEAEALLQAAEHARAQARRETPVEGTSTEGVAEAAAALAAKFAAAPVPADYEDAGRDFAPGLAGKYTTSHAEAAAADDDYEDYDADDYQPPRAVGD